MTCTGCGLRVAESSGVGAAFHPGMHDCTSSILASLTNAAACALAMPGDKEALEQLEREWKRADRYLTGDDA